jgi:hypothetical protein
MKKNYKKKLYNNGDNNFRKNKNLHNNQFKLKATLVWTYHAKILSTWKIKSKMVTAPKIIDFLKIFLILVEVNIIWTLEILNGRLQLIIKKLLLKHKWDNLIVKFQ